MIDALPGHDEVREAILGRVATLPPRRGRLEDAAGTVPGPHGIGIAAMSGAAAHRARRPGLRRAPGLSAALPWRRAALVGAGRRVLAGSGPR